jgi:hypothetical protein
MPAAMTPRALQAWSVVVRAPETYSRALTPGTLKRSLFPPQGTEGSLARVNAQEVVYV